MLSILIALRQNKLIQIKFKANRKYTKIHDIKVNNYPTKQIEVYLRTLTYKYLVTHDK